MIDYNKLYWDLRRNPEMPARFEEIIALVYSRLLSPGDSAIDCGAHTGKHTLPMARLVAPAGRVYAIEANSTKSMVLEEKVRQESFSRVVSVFNCAVGEQSASNVSFYVLPRDPGKSSLQPREGISISSSAVKEVKLDVRRLDDMVTDVATLKFIKTDIEGAELLALRGGESIIRRSRPVIHFECGGVAYRPFGIKSADFFTFFETNSYVLVDIVGNVLPTLEYWLESDSATGLYDYVAIPIEHALKEELIEILRTASGVRLGQAVHEARK